MYWKRGKISVPMWNLLNELHAAIEKQGRPVQMWECVNQHLGATQLACQEKNLIERKLFIPDDEDERRYYVFELAYAGKFVLGLTEAAHRERHIAEDYLVMLRVILSSHHPAHPEAKRQRRWLADAVRTAFPGIDVVGTIDYALYYAASITQAANTVRTLTKPFRAPAPIA